MTASAYPLTWPAGRARTPASQRKRPQFRSGSGPNRTSASTEIRIVDARTRLADQLEKLGARYVVLSTNMELRGDGQIRASAAEPNDPGVALYFQLKGRPIVLACDRWHSVAGNLAAIAAHIDALRGQDRWGVGSIEQAFAGFTSLPPPIVPGDWRTVLSNPQTLAEAETTYRREIMTAHPDTGGSHARAAELNAAIAEARSALK